MHWIIALSWLQLTRLIANDTFPSVVVKLHQRGADGKVAGVTNTWNGLSWSAELAILSSSA